MSPDRLPQGMWEELDGVVPRGAEVTEMASGWDSYAFAVGRRIVVKRPKHPAAEVRLRREVALLALVRPRVSLAVPDLHLVEGPAIWSWHPMLTGDHLVSDGYMRLPEPARARLGQDLGRFLAQLNLVGVAEARAVGAVALPPWLGSEAVWARTAPVLSDEMRAAAERLVADFDALPPDPLGQVYGHFDGHGWNMAFDHGAQVLNGIYDFGDSGIGPRHQEFIYAGLISFDLMARVAAAYEVESGLRLDHGRIGTLAGMHRLWELAEAAARAAEQADYLTRFADWCAAFAGGRQPIR